LFSPFGICFIKPVVERNVKNNIASMPARAGIQGQYCENAQLKITASSFEFSFLTFEFECCLEFSI
jgi:hypothetical protein